MLQYIHINDFFLSSLAPVARYAPFWNVAVIKEPAEAQAPRSLAEAEYKIRNPNIHQSIMGWTFNPMPTPDLARLCKQIGLTAMEGIDRKFYPLVKELGMQVSLVS